MRASIDLNCDLGEGAGTDAELMPLISSANVACGAHAGDERTIRETVGLAMRGGVGIGAHPGYPDRDNFGRLPMKMERADLIAEIVRQIRLVREIASRAGAPLRHVKAHGALYNEALRDQGIADAIATAIAREASGHTAPLVLAMPGSALMDRARDAALPIAREGFIDRAYEPDGALRSRRLPGALHEDPKAAVAQALSFVREGGVRTTAGTFLELEVDTLCVHGDTPGAPAIAGAVRKAFADAGIEVKPIAWR
jgi:UPF0271 protein